VVLEGDGALAVRRGEALRGHVRDAFVIAGVVVIVGVAETTVGAVITTVCCTHGSECDVFSRLFAKAAVGSSASSWLGNREPWTNSNSLAFLVVTSAMTQHLEPCPCDVRGPIAASFSFLILTSYLLP